MGAGYAHPEALVSTAWVRELALQPEHGFHGMEGLKNMAHAIVPGIHDERLRDGRIFVKTEDAEDMARRHRHHLLRWRRSISE
jgi:hypothetical protein